MDLAEYKAVPRTLELGDENEQESLDWRHQSFDIGDSNTYRFGFGHDSQTPLASA